MRVAQPTERAVGMEYYASGADGTGGRLRERPEAFRVCEVEGVDPEPLSADPGVYGHLLVRATLTDRDTNGFAGELSDRLGISRGRVSWAGTKDKRAVTTQLFSIEGIGAGELPGIRGASLEPVGRLGRRLLLGDLAGNEFRVEVSDPDRPENAGEVTAELRAFGGGRVGVPNYFGTQRFGSRRPVTHEVGLALARGDPEGAVLSYVANPSSDEPEDAREARRYVGETRDWKGATERMPRRLTHERAMLHDLAGTGGGADADFLSALRAVPENLCRLFVHAAQSYAFNRVLSERLRRGLPFHRAVEGDVVCFSERAGGRKIPDADRLARATPGRIESVNRHVERGRAFVTAPLVGTGTELGGGEPGEMERAVLSDLGLEPGDFDLPEPFGSAGTRRAVLARVDPEVGRDPLSFSFFLPPGSYATVVLREYLKSDPGEGW